MRDRLRALLLLGSASLRADPVGAAVTTALSMLGAVASPLLAVAIGYTADQALRHGVSASTWIGILAVSGAVAAIFVLNEIEHQLRRGLEERASHQLDRDLMRMIAGMPGLRLQDDPAFQNEVAAFRMDHWLLGQAVQSLIATGALLVQMIATVAVLGQVAPVLLLLPLFALPNLVAVFENAVEPGTGMETRLLGLSDLLLERFRAPMARYAHEGYVHQFQGAALKVVSSLVFAAGLVGALGFLAVQLQQGRISSGTLITAIVLGGEISGQLGAAASRSAWLGWATSAVTRYLRIADRTRESSAALEAPNAGVAPASLSEGIGLEKVTFRYPGAHLDVLQDVSLVLPAGAVVAVVATTVPARQRW